MRLIVLVIALLGLPAAATAQQASALVDLARRGQADEAWRQWREMPPSVDRARVGVALAAETGDVAQGLTLYEDLVRQTGAPVLDALNGLAIGAMRSVAASRDHESRVAACAIVLQADTGHQGCWDVVRGVRADNANPVQQAFDAYRMADAGFRPWPDLLEQAAGQLPVADKVDVARQFTRLPAAERVALAAPGLESADASVRRTAASVLGDIDGPEAMSALRRTFDATEDFGARVGLAVALARHGDAEAMQLLQMVGGTLIGPAAIDAQLALAAAGNRSASPPQALLTSAPGAERGRIAVAVAPVAREAAESAVREMMRDPSPVIREAGFRAAGAIGLGGTRDVYSQLSQSDPTTRVAAALAVRDAVRRHQAGRRP